MLNLNEVNWISNNNRYLFCYAGRAESKNIYISIYPSKTLFRRPACRITFEMGHIIIRTKVKRIDKQNIHDAIYKLYEKAHNKYINNDLKILQRILQ